MGGADGLGEGAGLSVGYSVGFIVSANTLSSSLSLSAEREVVFGNFINFDSANRLPEVPSPPRQRRKRQNSHLIIFMM